MATHAKLPSGPRPGIDPRVLARAMLAAGLRPAGLAVKAGVSRTSIHFALTGGAVGPKTWDAIAAALNLELTLQ